MYSQKCQACGGDVVFNPKKQVVECVQCGTQVKVDDYLTSEKSFEQILQKAPTWKNETVVYQCEHCSAKLVVAKTDLAIKCDYCGATNIVKTEDLPGLRPDTIAVFKLTKEEAMARAQRWLSRRFFAPHWYKKTVEPDHFHGIYFPTFTFDAYTQSSYTGYELETRVETVYRDGKPLSHSRLIRHPISGTISKNFDDLLITATTTISPYAFAQLQPFETNKAYVYQKEYLSGYTATHYSKDAKQCWDEAKDAMRVLIKKDISHRYTGAVENLEVNTSFGNITYKYALLPIYVGHSSYNNQQYEVFVNGQSGKVYGKSPVSLGKVLLTTAAALAAIGTAIAVALFW